MRKLVLAAAIIGLAMFGVHSAADAGGGNPVTKKMKGSFSEQVVLSGVDHFDELARIIHDVA